MIHEGAIWKKLVLELCHFHGFQLKVRSGHIRTGGKTSKINTPPTLFIWLQTLNMWSHRYPQHKSLDVHFKTPSMRPLKFTLSFKTSKAWLNLQLSYLKLHLMELNDFDVEVFRMLSRLHPVNFIHQNKFELLHKNKTFDKTFQSFTKLYKNFLQNKNFTKLYKP